MPSLTKGVCPLEFFLLRNPAFFWEKDKKSFTRGKFNCLKIFVIRMEGRGGKQINYCTGQNMGMGKEEFYAEK